MLKDVAFELNKVTFTDKHQDSHTVLALQTALELKAKNIFLVGYDGYPKSSITHKEQVLINENEYSFSKIIVKVQLKSVLPSEYKIEVSSVYSLIS